MEYKQFIEAVKEECNYYLVSYKEVSNIRKEKGVRINGNIYIWLKDTWGKDFIKCIMNEEMR